MSGSRLARLPRHGKLVQSRVRARGDGRPVVALLSGAGDANFGDEWMLELLRRGLGRCRLVPLELPRTEARLERFGLAGGGYFSAVVIGGGTIINPYFLPRLSKLVEGGTPAWALGTGVGSAGFGVSESRADPGAWSTTLARFQDLGLRGPMSVRRIGDVPARVLGDLSLLSTPHGIGEQPRPRRVLVNIGGTAAEADSGEGLLDERALLGAVASGLQDLRLTGWKLVPFVAHRDDTPRLDRLGALIEGWDEPARSPRGLGDVPSLVADAGAVVAMRLHASAVGWIWGLPTLALGYRDKTADFAAAIGADESVLDLRGAEPSDVRVRVRMIGDGQSADPAIRASALLLKERLVEAMQLVEDGILSAG